MWKFPEAILRCITAPNFLYHVGVVDHQVAGVVAVRDAMHLYHLFVARAFQGRGLGRALWEHARMTSVAAGKRGAWTVNASPKAVPVYERFGFTATGPRVESRGIAFVPMASGFGEKNDDGRAFTDGEGRREGSRGRAGPPAACN